MINNEAAEKLIIFMMDKAITYRNRRLYVLGTFKNFGLVIEWLLVIVPYRVMLRNMQASLLIERYNNLPHQGYI